MRICHKYTQQQIHAQTEEDKEEEKETQTEKLSREDKRVF